MIGFDIPGGALILQVLHHIVSLDLRIINIGVEIHLPPFSPVIAEDQFQSARIRIARIHPGRDERGISAACQLLPALVTGDQVCSVFTKQCCQESMVLLPVCFLIAQFQ